MESNITVLESQVDWLTCSNHDRDGARLLEKAAEAIAQRTEAVENRRERFRLMGYEGWHQGRVRFGNRGNAGLVQLSGQVASDHWGECYALSDNVSRIDVEVTAHWALTAAHIGPALLSQALAQYAESGRYPRPEFHGDGDGGFTFQLGRRSAPWVLRVYDKAAEVKRHNDAELDRRYANCWRFEVEAKAASAASVAETLGSGQEIAPACRALVAQHMERHGLTVPFPTTGKVEVAKGIHRASDRLSKLRWIDKQVRPAVQWLVAQGEVSEVWKALGLAWGDSPRPEGCEEA